MRSLFVFDGHDWVHRGGSGVGASGSKGMMLGVGDEVCGGSVGEGCGEGCGGGGVEGCISGPISRCVAPMSADNPTLESTPN